MKRLGIFGGTFNPPHKGHIYIAQQAKIAAGLDKVLVIPCGNPPHKTLEGDISADARLKMTSLAVDGIADLEVCDIEVRSTEKSYTAETLKKLKALYPDCELCFIVGGDSLDYMEKWYHPEEIFKLAEIVAVSRKGLDIASAQKKAEYLESRYSARITLVEIEPMDVSSSEIRENIKKGKSVSSFLEEGVLDFIRINEIYKEA